MECLKKIVKVYFILIILGLICFKISNDYVIITAVDTLMLVGLLRYFKFDKKEKLMFLLIIACVMTLLALDIKNYFSVYKAACYMENYSIYPEIVLDLLSLLNLPFNGMLYILYRFNLLEYKFLIIIIYLLLLVGLEFKFSKIQLNQKNRYN